MRARGWVVIALVATTAAATSPAWGAAFEPSHAQADAATAIREQAYPFCKDPHEPLSPEAMNLCDHASAVPDCGGFAASCAKAMSSRSTSWPPWWARWSLPPIIGLLAQWAVWLIVAALVVAVLVPIVRGVARASRKDPGAPERAAPLPLTGLPILAELASMTDEEAILAKARQLAAAGDLAAALQLYLLASLRALDKRGAVRLTKDRTNGEYVRSCADTGAKPALRDIVREVDRVQFGGLAPSHEGVERAGQRAFAIVRALPMAMMVTAMALCLGCSGVSLPKPHRTGDDPAGAELLHDVLAKQGVTLGGLESSLATMPLPTAGQRAPAVIVDMERTALDDDSREHLLTWVEEGGVLVLAGFPESWPKAFGIRRDSSSGPHEITARRLLARAVPPSAEDGESEDDTAASGDEESAIYAHDEEHGELISGGGLKVAGAFDKIAWFGDSTPYALTIARGKGIVLALADNELLTNVGIARPTNAAALVAILAATSRTQMRLADADDGMSPPSTPIAALLRAGLGLALLHAAAFCVVLFLAVGIRQRRPTPVPPPRRRAFAEHVEAVGALYARARSAPHALSAYAKFADERLRPRLPRGSSDIAAFLSSRARMPLDVCQRLWARAMHAKAGAPPLGDELSVLRELTALYAAATAQDR